MPDQPSTDKLAEAQIDRASPLDIAADKVGPLGEEVFGEQHSQRRTREVIAVWLLGLLCALVGLAFTAYFLDFDSTPPTKRFENLKTLLDVLVGPIITLLSSAIGFYFGSRSVEAASRIAAERSSAHE